jgi:septal ring factor EnvC (AmiA/AmiB activator)
MPTLDERVATLEGRMTPDLREEMQRGFAETRQEFSAVRAEFTAVRAEMHRGFAEVREEMARMRQDMTRGFERADDRMERQFRWIISIQLTAMVAILGVVAAAFFRTL